MREHDRAADHLIGVLRIHAQTDREVDGLIELGDFAFFTRATRLFDAVLARAFDDLVDFRAVLRYFGISSLFDLFGLPPVDPGQSRRGGLRGFARDAPSR